MDESERLRLRAELLARQEEAYARLGLERPGTFLHAVHLRDMTRWNNFVLAGWHVAAGWAAMDPAFQGYESVRDVSIERLRDDPPVNVSSAFASDRIYSAALIRRGGHVGVGIPPYPTKWATQDEEARLLQLGDIELDFEACRRRVAPEAASRIASLFVAEDTAEGAQHLRQMFGSSLDLWLLRVEIPAAIRFTRADTRWFDEYTKDAQPGYVESYWKEERFPADGERWEYLVEGVLKLVEDKQLTKFRLAGAMALGVNVVD